MIVLFKPDDLKCYVFSPRSKESQQPPVSLICPLKCSIDWIPRIMDEGGEGGNLQHPWRFVMEGDKDGETSKSL